MQTKARAPRAPRAPRTPRHLQKKTAAKNRGKHRSWTVHLFKNNLQDLFFDTSSMSQLNREL